MSERGPYLVYRWVHYKRFCAAERTSLAAVDCANYMGDNGECAVERIEVAGDPDRYWLTREEAVLVRELRTGCDIDGYPLKDDGG